MNNWTSDIHDKLSNHKGKAPEGLLDDIKKEMSGRGAAPVRKKTVPLWYFRTAAAAVLAAVIFGTGYYFIKDNTQVSPIASVGNTPVKTAPEPKSAPVYADTTLAPEQNQLPVLKAIYKNPGYRGVQDYIAQTAADVLRDSVVSKETVKNNSGNAAVRTDTLQGKTEPENRRPARYFDETSVGPDYTDYKLPVKTSRKNSYTIGAYYAGTMMQKTSTMSGYLTMADPIGEHDRMMSGLKGVYDITSDSKTKTKHYQPMMFGVSLRYNITDKWGIQSGLTYSYLYSETVSVSPSSSFKSKQRLHYLGIPLSFTYSIWKNEKFNIYATAGGQIDKLVSGSIETDLKIEGAEKNHIEDDVSERNIHSSVNLSAGAEFLFNRRFSLYAEPGIVYHFDNHSSINTIYNESSVKFNLNVGLRYTLNN